MWWKNDLWLTAERQLWLSILLRGSAVVKRHIPCSTSFKKDFISVQFANLQIRQWILAQVTQGKRATDAVAWVVTVGSLSSNFHRYNI